MRAPPQDDADTAIWVDDQPVPGAFPPESVDAANDAAPEPVAPAAEAAPQEAPAEIESAAAAPAVEAAAEEPSAESVDAAPVAEAAPEPAAEPVAEEPPAETQAADAFDDEDEPAQRHARRRVQAAHLEEIAKRLILPESALKDGTDAVISRLDTRIKVLEKSIAGLETRQSAAEAEGARLKARRGCGPAAPRARRRDRCQDAADRLGAPARPPSARVAPRRARDAASRRGRRDPVLAGA